MNKTYTLECCVDSVESAVNAQKGDADRLELCANLVIGGTTPTLALFEKVREMTDIRIHVLIRPRFGDFLYSSHEADIICQEIRNFRRMGADGVVIGALNPDGSLNIEQMKRFIDSAGSMSVTLHRAFDMCRDPFSELEHARQLGVSTILTSGQASSCLAGLSVLNRLAAAAGNDITILAGAGIDADAVKILLADTNLTAFHMSGKKTVNSGMLFRNPFVNMGLPGLSEYDIWQTDAAKVRAVRALLDAASQMG